MHLNIIFAILAFLLFTPNMSAMVSSSSASTTKPKEVKEQKKEEKLSSEQIESLKSTATSYLKGCCGLYLCDESFEGNECFLNAQKIFLEMEKRGDMKDYLIALMLWCKGAKILLEKAFSENYEFMTVPELKIADVVIIDEKKLNVAKLCDESELVESE